MADFDGDANATPLSKLPPPIMQSKAGMQLDVPNYADVAKAAYGGEANNQYPQQPQMQQPQMQQPQMQQQQQQPRMQAFDMHQALQQQPQQAHQQQHAMMPQALADQQAMMPQQHQQPSARVMERQIQHMARQMRAQQQQLKAARRETYTQQQQQQKQQSVWTAWLDWRRYKPGLLVAGIVLVMLVHGVPRIKAGIPQLVTPVGRLNHLGFVAVALATGAAYQASSRFVLDE